MSTKTSIKRIALVAVSALGFGLLSSVAPASAAASTTLSVSGIARAGVGLQLTSTKDGGDSEYLHVVATGALPSGGAFATY